MNIINPIDNVNLYNLLKVFKEQLEYKNKLKFISQNTEAYKYDFDLNDKLFQEFQSIRYFLRDYKRYNQLIIIPITIYKFCKFFPEYSFLLDLLNTPRYSHLAERVIDMSYFEIVRKLVRTHKTFEINYKSEHISEEMFFKYDFKLEHNHILPLICDYTSSKSLLHNGAYVINYPNILSNNDIACFYTRFIFIVTKDWSSYGLTIKDLKDNLFIIKLCNFFGLKEYLYNEYDKSKVSLSNIFRGITLRIYEENYSNYRDLINSY